jgi:hypothetical protein
LDTVIKPYMDNISNSIYKKSTAILFYYSTLFQDKEI